MKILSILTSTLIGCALYGAEPTLRTDSIEVGSKWRNTWITWGDWELHVSITHEKANLFTVTKFENGKIGLVQYGADNELPTTWLSEAEFRENFKKLTLPPRLTKTEQIPPGLPVPRDWIVSK